MSSSLIIGPGNEGLIQTPPSNVPFLVEDPNSVWLVESGKLDLFLVRRNHDELVDARFPLLRIEEGQAIFGIGSSERDFAVVATALPDTKIVVLGRTALQEMFLAGREDLPQALLDQWIIALSLMRSEDAAPATFQALEAGQTITIGEDVTTLVSNHPVVWVNHQKGRSYFLGRGDLPVNGGAFFPLSRNSWLKATPGSELLTVDSRTFFELDRQWRGLSVFHSLVLACMLRQRGVAAQRVRERLQARAQSDSASLRGALLRLVTPIHGIPTFLENEAGCQDPLFLACSVIGSRIGIKIKPSAEMLHGLAVADPIAAIARESAIRVRKVSLKGQWWKGEVGPLLAFQEKENQPVALLPRATRGMDVYTPADGSVRKLTPEVATSLNPFAYVMYRPLPARQLTIVDLLKFGVFGCKRELVTIILMGIAGGVLGIIPPYVTGVIFDRLIPGAERTQLLEMSAFLFLVAISASMFAFVRGFAVLRLEGKIDASLQAACWDRLLSLPVSFFREFTAGDLAQRSLGISYIREALTGSTLTAILSGLFSTFSLLLLFYYSWKLAFLATALVGIACIISMSCGVFQLRRHRTLVKLHGAISSMLLQFITGIAKFRTAGSEGRAFAVWARQFSEQKRVATETRRIANVLTVFNSAFPAICMAILFGYASMILSQQGQVQLTSGEFVAFLAAFTQFLGSSLNLTSTAVYALSVVPIYERAKPIFRTLPEVNESKASPGQLLGNIEISNIRFRYAADTPLILRDLSLRICAGEFVAFVGASGTGKSTLLRLLLGFEVPESGAIYFDGHDLSALDVQAVRRQIGVVLQSSRPIGGSIFENIVGSAPLGMADAWEAARLAGLAEEIEKMPMGLHTYITDGGGGISGGQRQRLMIARAIVAKPRILLMDEATSALDNHTQEIVSRSLESLRATRVVIAHRLSTIKNADRICVLEKGTVVQTGTYQQLLEEEGVFKVLAQRQLA